MTAIRLPVVVSLLMVAVPFAGCVELEDLLAVDPSEPGTLPARLASTEDIAPLAVPAIADGEVASFKTSTVGYTLDHGHHTERGSDQSVEVVPYSNNHTSKREVRSTSVTDAWLRPVAGVEYVHSFDSDGISAHQDLSWNARTVYEAATRLSIVSEFRYWQAHHSTTCVNGSCSSRESSGVEQSTAYPRVREEAAWGDLAGTELRIGQTLHFEKTLPFYGSEYLITLDYAVLREDWIDGERAFVVDVKTDMKRVSGPDDGHHSLEHEEHEIVDDEVPPPSTLLWYTSEASVPARQVSEHSFRHDGQVYTTTSTTTLESFEPGKTPIGWGLGDPVAPIMQVAAERAVPFEQYLGRNGWGSYPMAQAWNQIERDLLLRDYQNWKQSHPAARPQVAAFVQNAEHDERVWMFGLNDGASSMTVGSRMSYPTPLPVPVYENRDNMMPGIHFIDRSAAPLSPGTPLMTVAQAKQIYDQVGQPSRAEPGVLLRFAPHVFGGDDDQATVVFGRATDDFRATVVGANVYVGELEDPVTIDLMDGGLRAINADWASYMIFWSQLPTFASMTLGAEADGTLGSAPLGLEGAPFQLPLDA